MKIQTVIISGFRNVPDGTYDLQGKNVILAGDNTVGKTNFMNAIKIAIAKQMAGPQAIKIGADEASIKVTMADFEKVADGQLRPIDGTNYQYSCRIRRSKGQDEVVELEVVCPDGLKEHRKTVIGTITGEIEQREDFVALSSTKAGKARQMEIVKGYLNDEDRRILRIREQQVEGWYKERTENNRQIAQVESYIKMSSLNPKDHETYAKELVVSELLEQRDKMVAHNTQFDGVVERMNQRVQEAEQLDKDIKEWEEKIAAARGKLIEIATKNSEANKFMKANPKLDTSAVDKQIREAETHNEKHRQVKDYALKESNLGELREITDDLTAKIELGRQAIQDAIRDMEFPIDGVTWDEENVYYHGKMIDPATMSTAEIKMFKAKLDIAAMKNSEVLFVGSAESIGQKLLEEMQQIADQEGIQLILEQVERGTEELQLRFLSEIPKEKEVTV